MSVRATHIATARDAGSAIHYPESDGRPMGETEVHIQCLIDTREALRAKFRDDPFLYVGANMLLYYEEGNPRRFVSPDVFVVRGVPKRVRRTYKVWEEGRAPDFVLEITSDSTRREDLVTKRNLYERLGVAEYFLFDPLDEYLHPPLRGYRLVSGRYEPLASTDPDRLPSEVLGLELRRRDGDLRLYDPQEERWLPTPDELNAALRAEAAAREAAQAATRAALAAREAAEAELARLRQELDRLRARHPGAP